MTSSLPLARDTASSRLTRVTPVGCRDCGFRIECGGLDGQQDMYGCFLDCQASGTCDLHDWTCPCKPRLFHQRLRDVHGLSTTSIGPLPQPDDISLPLYVPMVQHGYSRRLRLAVDVAAVSPFELLRVVEGKYQPNVLNREHLLRKFKLSARCSVLLVSPTDDPPLELYWGHRRLHETAAALARLGTIAMTVPNFSFFENAPRPHTLWNLKRMLMVAEELTTAGLPAIVHLNALTAADWKFWTQFLRERPQIKFVAKEFQTGLKNPRLADAALSSLRALQDTLGRAIHPIIIAGRRFVPECARIFETFTLVDSNPFMKAVHRQRAYLQADGEVGWEPAPTPSGAPVDQLLSANIRTYEMSVALAAGRLHTHRQLMLPFEHSSAAPM